MGESAIRQFLRSLLPPDKVHEHEMHLHQHIFPQIVKLKLRRSLHLLRQQQLSLITFYPLQEARIIVCHLNKQLIWCMHLDIMENYDKVFSKRKEEGPDAGSINYKPSIHDETHSRAHLYNFYQNF